MRALPRPAGIMFDMNVLTTVTDTRGCRVTTFS
jgi:hypothetical protein